MEAKTAAPVTILIHYTGPGDNARRFAEEMTAAGVVARIRSEAGNLGYDYYFPAEDPRTVLLVDRWAGQAALDAHHTSPMMAEIAALREQYGLTMQVERFVPDSGGIPANDEKYIQR